jgi:hypothetical protein
MAGKRDFSEFNAKLEKHIERLPDYAQRAQEKLQKYLPPQGEGAKPSSSGRQGRPVPRPPVPRRPTKMTMSSALSSVPIPVVNEVRTKWEAWNDPAAKHERRKVRASRMMTLWIVLTILCGLYAVLVFTGALGVFVAGALVQKAIMPVLGVALFGTLSVRSGAKLHQLKKVALPASTKPVPLPAASSAAREPMEHLAESEATLRELLKQLSAPTSLGTTAIPAISVEDARATAAEAAGALRALAERIVAIERARNASPASERVALDQAIATLREQLDDGMHGFGLLVAAAGYAVGASSGGLSASKRALTDATDHLAGLAMALRELS